MPNIFCKIETKPLKFDFFFPQTIQVRQDYVSCGVCGFGISGGGRVPSVRPRFWHFNEGSNEVFHATKFLEASLRVTCWNWCFLKI
jgi:hypothetical protein